MIVGEDPPNGKTLLMVIGVNPQVVKGPSHHGLDSHYSAPPYSLVNLTKLDDDKDVDQIGQGDVTAWPCMRQRQG